MELEGRIYKITNIITSKIYIGCTTKTIENRFLEHKSRSKSKKHNSKLYNSINKYGIDNFIIEEICKCNIDKMFELEKNYILEFNSFENGYNTTYGGEGCLGYKHSNEVKEKMSNIQKEKMKELRIDKTYEEIYGDTANIEKEKRSNSGKQYWENCSDEDKNKRIDNQINTLIIKSGYSKELIHNVRKLKFEDKLKPKQIQKIYPELTINNINNITNKRRWNSIYQS